MCGRFSLFTDRELIEGCFGVVWRNLRPFTPRYNIAPTQEALIVLMDDQARMIKNLRWGLVPSWLKDKQKSGLINVRAASLLEKPSFRDSFQKRRCLVPASGFFEWKDHGQKIKQPFFIAPQDQKLWAFAGIFENNTFSIITTDAQGGIRDLHDRMPLVIGPENFQTWLNPSTPIQQVQSLLTQKSEISTNIHPVDTRVNSPKFDDASLIEPQVPHP